jgi:hypothetical protein
MIEQRAFRISLSLTVLPSELHLPEGALEANNQGNHLKALELYMLAMSPYNRVIPTLVKNQQMKFAAFYLSNALNDPAALTATAWCSLVLSFSGTLARCHSRTHTLSLSYPLPWKPAHVRV